MALWRPLYPAPTVGPAPTNIMARGIVHDFRNDTRVPASRLCVLTPAFLGSAYFRATGARIAHGSPDPSEMKGVVLRYGLVPALAASA